MFWKEHHSLSTRNRVRETCPKLVLTDKAYLFLFNWTDPVPVMLHFSFYLKRETLDAVPSMNDTKCDTPSWLGIFRTIILKIQVIWNVKPCHMVEASWNVMAHMQKPDFVFRRNRRVHLNRWGCHFSRLLAAEVCASALIVGSNAGYTMFRGSEKSTGYPLHSPVSPSLPLPCVNMCHHI
jgi:hypothetical protein